MIAFAMEAFTELEQNNRAINTTGNYQKTSTASIDANWLAFNIRPSLNERGKKKEEIERGNGTGITRFTGL